MQIDFNIKKYVQQLADIVASTAAHNEARKEQARQNLARELNHNSVHFNYAHKTESNLIKIDRSIYKKTKEDRMISNHLRSEYKKAEAAFRSAEL